MSNFPEDNSYSTPAPQSLFPEAENLVRVSVEAPQGASPLWFLQLSINGKEIHDDHTDPAYASVQEALNAARKAVQHHGLLRHLTVKGGAR
jgi:hypothetical protein